jgi:uncharacterized membrane protein
MPNKRSQMEDQRTFGDRVSDSIAKFGGSWKFIFAGMGIIAIWVVINLLPIAFGVQFDQYPFILLNLFLSLIAAFQAPFILMSQRRCEIKQDMIYRSLFREIKELVETDLSLEHELVERNKKLEYELRMVKRMLRRLRKKGD